MEGICLSASGVALSVASWCARAKVELHPGGSAVSESSPMLLQNVSYGTDILVVTASMGAGAAAAAAGAALAVVALRRR